MKTGIELIADERQRQIEVEGYTPYEDRSKYEDNELFHAACCYSAALRCRAINEGKPYFPDAWPWGAEYWKPTPGNRIRECEKAGALFMAHQELTGADMSKWIESMASEIDKIQSASL